MNSNKTSIVKKNSFFRDLGPSRKNFSSCDIFFSEAGLSVLIVIIISLKINEVKYLLKITE